MKLPWFVWRVIPHSHGMDNIVMIDKTPEVFGGYEIWECKKCRWTEAI